MPLQFTCRSCDSLLAVPSGTQGMKTCCPACRSIQEIPEQAVATQADLDDKIQVACPECRQLLVCDRSLLNTKGLCKNCQCVFLITDQPQSSPTDSVGCIFHCPQCQQMFEGQPQMQGRSGRCHNCGVVFTIDLKWRSNSSGTHGAR